MWIPPEQRYNKWIIQKQNTSQLQYLNDTWQLTKRTLGKKKKKSLQTTEYYGTHSVITRSNYLLLYSTL